MSISVFNKPYILGLDLGIASVGWAMIKIDENETPIALIDLGVRTFERAEVPKTGESLAASRRLARSARRSIRRRAHRLLRLKRKIKTIGLLSKNEFDENEHIKKLPVDAWHLRAKGLDKKLNNKEWAAVLIHLVKHRGYCSMRKSENTELKELGLLLQGIKHNNELMKEHNYRSAAELAINEFKEHLRNKSGDYSHTFSRLLIANELTLLFNKQREFGNQFTGNEFEAFVYQIIIQQKPAISGEAILHMLGKCSLEPNEYKAAKASYSAERFVWLTKLNNLRLCLSDGTERNLTEQEFKQLIDEPYKKAKLTYSQIRKTLDLPDDDIFKGLRYLQEKTIKKVEDQTIMELKGFHQIRKCLENAGLKTEWQSLATERHKLDAIATAFSLYKTDEDIVNKLAELNLTKKVEQALLELNFDKFINHSLKVLGKLLPLMEKQYRYDQAVEKVYPNHKIQAEDRQIFLPVIPEDEIRNPVVLRALSQTRKVINNIILRYGSPARIHIETGRELGKSFKDRRAIEKMQGENQQRKERQKTVFQELFPSIHDAKSKDILKYRLYEEQGCQCLYSGKPIDINRIRETGYLEIDHVLPYSRAWDDSYNNKVLVLAQSNRNKANQTPYEWLAGKDNSPIWQVFCGRVNSLRIPYAKKQRILSKQLPEGFKDRNLNDTRWISRYLMNFIQEHLQLTGKEKRNIFASNGQLTAMLRGRWGLRKSREDNDRHHCLDAIVVACTTRSIQQKITSYIKQNELKNLIGNHFIDPTTGEIVDLKLHDLKNTKFPKPWDWFTEEINIRVFADNPVHKLSDELPDRKEAHHRYIRPLFVSRAPAQKATGPAHQETIRSAKRLDEGISVKKVPLTALKLKNLESIVNYHREPQLIEALKRRLEQFNDDGKKAFVEPFYKPNKRGEKGEIIYTMRTERTQNAGVRIRENKMGVADNAQVVRVDVFTKAKRYFLIPVYTWQVATNIQPNLAIVSGKVENDWTEIDDSFEFLFSLFSNDLIEVKLKEETIFGYYRGVDRSNGRINIIAHDRKQVNNSDSRRVGIKTALDVVKYKVDVLGNYRRVKHEKRSN